MKGLQLAEEYCRAVGMPVLSIAFPELFGRMAFGLAGDGSECFGFDDEISRDHDWGPGFCVWLDEEDYSRFGAAVQAVYDNLPKEYLGFPARHEIPGGGKRVGCLCTQQWIFRYTGTTMGPHSLEEWRKIPENFLAVAVNGALFSDPVGTLTAVRQHLARGYPEDLRLKKLAARTAVMAQAGQYNYVRCLRRGEPVAAQLALDEFMRATISMAYLLERKYVPFYKWAHRGLYGLKWCPQLPGQLILLCSNATQEEKAAEVEAICTDVAEELHRQGLVKSPATFLLDLCPELVSHIKNSGLRQMHIMEG